MTLKAQLGLALALFISVSYGQEPETVSPLQARVAELERQLAGLETRLDARTTAGAGGLGDSVSGLAARAEIDRLAQELAALASQVDRLARQVDQNTREVGQARRGAHAAELAAREALTRVR